MEGATGDLQKDLGCFTSLPTLVGHKGAIYKQCYNMQCSAYKQSFHALPQHMHRAA